MESTVVVPEVGRELADPVAGSRTVFLATAESTAGAYVEVEQTYRPHSAKPVLHHHPEQDEHFVVLSGRLVAVVGGEERVVEPGQELDIPRGTPHLMWGDADEPTVVRWRTTPALGTDRMWCELWSAAAEHGFVPDPLRSFSVVQRYPREFQLSALPRQR